MIHRQRRRGRSRMSCGGDSESEGGSHQRRHGYVKRCAPALHNIAQSGHSSQHYGQTGGLGPRIAGKPQDLCSNETVMRFCRGPRVAEIRHLLSVLNGHVRSRGRITIGTVSRAPVPAAVLVFGLLAGCYATVAGQAVRGPRNTLERALPDASELKRVLGLPIASDSPPEYGRRETLTDDKDSSSPTECAGVTHAGYRRTYQGAPLLALARGSWITPQDSDDRVDVAISVVELDSAGSAQNWYVTTAAQWAKCQGVTVTESTSAVSFLQNIHRVTDSDGTLTAELSVSTDNGLMAPVENRRAFTATSQYLIDAEVFGTLRHPDSSALDAGAVAHLVADRIS
jgi:hypothetical protein